jgi:alpha-ketoglutarate-dependent taurine dioxygenase
MLSRSSAEDVTLGPALPAGPLPVILSPTRSPMAALDAIDAIRVHVDRHLPEAGAVLLRGFVLDGAADFRRLCASFGSSLLGYEYGSTPRTQLDEGVYSSTEYPPHQHIPLHNEQSYSRQWPMKIWFYCALAAERGGETPIADSREIYRKMPAAIRDRWSQRGLMYVRNFGNGLDVPWQRVFNATQRADVESYCKSQGIHYEWKADGELRTRQICQAVAQHPRTSERVWFNQAHLFHISALPVDVREALLEAVPVEDLPRNVYYADGQPIEDSLLDEVRAVLDGCKRVFTWHPGDVLMLDNMLTAHARHPFEGPRKVIVAMAEPHSPAI